MNKCFLHICLKFLKICSFFNFSRSSTIFTKLMIFVPFCASFLVHFAPYFCACLSILSGVWIAFNNSWYIKEFVLWRFLLDFFKNFRPVLFSFYSSSAVSISTLNKYWNGESKFFLCVKKRQNMWENIVHIKFFAHWRGNKSCGPLRKKVFDSLPDFFEILCKGQETHSQYFFDEKKLLTMYDFSISGIS